MSKRWTMDEVNALRKTMGWDAATESFQDPGTNAATRYSDSLSGTVRTAYAEYGTIYSPKIRESLFVEPVTTDPLQCKLTWNAYGFGVIFNDAYESVELTIDKIHAKSFEVLFFSAAGVERQVLEGPGPHTISAGSTVREVIILATHGILRTATYFR